MWGVIINGIQAAVLEHNGMRTAPWNGATSKGDLTGVRFC
jgi:solute carrier family 35, member F1/2